MAATQRARRAWQLGLAFAAQYLKGVLAFRWDFWVHVGGIFLGQAVNLLAIAAIFSRIPHLQGWRYEQVLLIFGMSQLTLNLCYVFGTSLANVNRMVLDGQFDQFLVRPVDPLFQLVAQDMGLQPISAAFTSLVIVLIALWQLPHLPGWAWLAMPVLVTGGAATYFGLALIAASAAFWWQDRHGIVWTVLVAGDFVSRYPITLYNPSIRFIVTWVLPFAFTAFYPATLLMGIRTWAAYAWATPLVGLASCLLGIALWRQGLKRYGSSGS